MKRAQRSIARIFRRKIEPGVTYKDVEVRWRAGARIVHPADDWDAE